MIGYSHNSSHNYSYEGSKAHVSEYAKNHLSQSLKDYPSRNLKTFKDYQMENYSWVEYWADDDYPFNYDPYNDDLYGGPFYDDFYDDFYDYFNDYYLYYNFYVSLGIAKIKVDYCNNSLKENFYDYFNGKKSIGYMEAYMRVYEDEMHNVYNIIKYI